MSEELKTDRYSCDTGGGRSYRPDGQCVDADITSLVIDAQARRIKSLEGLLHDGLPWFHALRNNPANTAQFDLAEDFISRIEKALDPDNWPFLKEPK
jgi:hypothetical protein